MDFTVFLVDDEPLIVDGLAETIRSLGLPLQIVGYAYSGETALDAIKEKHPQIILSDIRMRRMSGLDLYKQVCTIFPQSKTIFLSGYSDFEYVQTALQYQALDYLLKPIQTEDLRRSLQKAIGAIQQQAENRTNLMQLQNYLDASRPYIRDLFFGYIKAYPEARPESFPLYKLFEIPSETNYFLPIYIAFPDLNSLFDAVHFEQNDFLFHLIDCSFTSRHVEHLSFFDSDSLVFVLFAATGPDFSVSALESVAVSLRELLALNTNVAFSIGVGSAAAALGLLPDAYLDAKRASGYHFLFGKNNIIFSHDLNFSEFTFSGKDFEEIGNEIVQSILVGNSSRVKELISDFLVWVCQKYTELSKIRQTVIELFFHLLNAIYTNTLEKSYPEADAIAFTSQLWASSNAAEIQQLLTTFCEQCIELLSTRRNDKVHRIIDRINGIIERDYRTVSLESICDEIGLSPSYTSTLFSSIEQRTIKDSIIAAKIRAAKKMLADPSCRIYEVADAVGYSDTKYFSQIFRRQTGMSPEQFRR